MLDPHEIPDSLPEFVETVDTPSVQVRVVGKLQVVCLVY
jgi:hypothetical protein